MPTSNRIILTDVDGVLLEWENHFTKWMISRGAKLKNEFKAEYDMQRRFVDATEDIKLAIREFNKSAWMGTQPPMPESQTWVKLLHAEGWTFIPISSQTSDIPAQELRKRRLEELFGEYAFYNFHILETGQDKDNVLAEFHGTGLWWIEDKWTNALAGLKYGLKPLFIDHPYNREYSHPDITRVNNWKQIHEIVSNDGR
tara:strand:+ start:1210 stop:1806 length:597 start_codon:yes stop_codon:yes gene_type:complete